MALDPIWISHQGQVRDTAHVSILAVRKSRLEKRRQLPPGPNVPSAVQLLSTWTRPAASALRCRDMYGHRFTVRMPFQPPMVIISDPGEIKELFMLPPDAAHPGEGARILEPIVGRYSVILLDEDPHLEQRRLMLPAFHGEKMLALRALMEELTAEELETWPLGEPVRLHPRLQRLTLEIILRSVFGLERGGRLNELRDLLTAVMAFSESPLSVVQGAQVLTRVYPPLRRFEAKSRRADELIFALIEERRAAGQFGDDVLSMLLQARHEDGTAMSAQELRDELITALVAGHETTASQLAWAFMMLARDDRVTACLTDELDAGEGDEYLTATVQEIMRLRPVLANAEPRLTKRAVTIGGFTYPPGVLLLASALLVQRDPEIYPDPHAFRPERFLGTAPGTYTWIPFGGGRRRCLGASFAMQEMKIVLAAALRRFTLSPASPSTPEPTGRRSITFSPRRGATVVLSARVPGSAPVEPERKAALIG